MNSSFSMIGSRDWPISREDRLAELLERWEEAAAQGQALTPEFLCRDCPDLFDDFQELLGQLGPINAMLAAEGLGDLDPQEKGPPVAPDLLR